MAGGRPSKYNPELHLAIVEALTSRGLTIPQLAEALKVHSATVNRWMVESVEFCEAVKKARELVDERVEASLYQRATGYDHKAVKIFMPAGTKEPVYAEYVQHVPPDPASMIFYLKNRKPKQWRDAREQDEPPSLILNAPSATPIKDGIETGTVEIQE